MTKFSSVAHLYLGIEMKLNDNISTFCANSDTRNPRGNRFVFLSAGLLADFHARIFQWSDFKPILRSLSSMTKNETNEMLNRSEKAMFDFQGEEIDNALASHIAFSHAAVTLYLTKNGFDIFGLIKSGEAIDATTLRGGDQLIPGANLS